MTAKALLLSAGDGTAVPAGSVGEKLEVADWTTFTQATPTENTIYDITGASLTLTKGVWRIVQKINMQSNATSDNGQRSPWVLALMRDSSNSIIDQATLPSPYFSGVTTSGFNNVGTVLVEAYVSISSSTTYKASMKWRNAQGGTVTVASMSSNTDIGANSYYGGGQYIRAIRIA